MLENKNPYSNQLYRRPEDIMSLKRMGAMHQSRISFTRSLVRKIAEEKWDVFIETWDISEDGFGTVIYRVNTPNHVYQLVIFTNYIEDDERDDRVIAEKWDCTFVLIQGIANASLLQTLKENVPRQEAGRNGSEVLVLSRANKSVRIFNHIVDRLSEGKQPDIDLLKEVGYILRTTAVYGNGKFGVVDFEYLEDNPDFCQSFSAQMCAVYLLRQFSIDWVHYLAKKKGGDKSTVLHKDLQEFLGTGNATGLGMSLFLINHPKIVDNWMSEREKALSKVLSQPITEADKTRAIALLTQAKKHIAEVITADERQKALNEKSVEELGEIIATIEPAYQQKLRWSYIINVIEQYSFEAQEITVSCMIDSRPDLVDEHVAHMNANESYMRITGIKKDELISILEEKYSWAYTIDFEKPDSSYWFWYSSEDKEEPRLGIRYEDDGYELELPLDIARQISILYKNLTTAPKEWSMADFLLEYPEQRCIIRRIYTMAKCELGEIRANSIGKELLPMDLLRAKLSVLGATKFDPRSDRWVQVTFFQGAPLLSNITTKDWAFPTLPDISVESYHAHHEMVMRERREKRRVTYNEVMLNCSRAFRSLHRKWGDHQMIANATADIEIMGQHGISRFVDFLDLVAKDNEHPPKIEVKDKHTIYVDLEGSSVLSYLSILIDYAIERLDSHIILQIVNEHNNWLALGRIIQLHFDDIYVQAIWKEEHSNEYIEYIYGPDDKEDHIYISELNTEQKKDLTFAHTLHENNLYICLSKTHIQSHLKDTHPKEISTTQLHNKRKSAMQHGLYVNEDDWAIIKKATQTLLVPNSEKSKRQAGA